MSASEQRKTTMNGEQLYNHLTTVGLKADHYGHVNVLLDIWTGRVLSTTFHPAMNGETDRSMTIIVGSCDFEAMKGHLLAGGVPTTFGGPLDEWLDVCNTAIDGASLVSTSYVGMAYEEIGFSISKFLEVADSKNLDQETRQQHLDSRLNYAMTRRYLNKTAEAIMDLPEADRPEAVQQLEVAYMYVDMVSKILTEIDGQ